MPGGATGSRAPALLFALRLEPASPQGTLQGEVEQVLSGERCRFDGACELLAWLGEHSRADRAVPPQAPGCPSGAAAAPAAPGARDATT